MIPNVLRRGSPQVLGIFIVYLHRSMIALALFYTKCLFFYIKSVKDDIYNL